MVEIRKIGITKLAVDAIVNAANDALLQGSGVCGAIFNEAGAARLQKACDRYGGCPTGQAVITPGFALKADYIIHAVGPRWSGGHRGEKQALFSCYQAALQLALEHRCRSIAFPLISAGIFGYPKAEAWAVALDAVEDFLQKNPKCGLQVTFAVLDDAILALGQQTLQARTR